MIVVETMMATALLCTSTKKKCTDSDIVYFTTQPRPALIHLTTGETLETIVSDKIKSLPHVDGVSVRRNGPVVSVDVEMSKFDKATRRSVYAVERQLAEQYPNHSVDVRLIDKSPENQSRDAVKG